MAEQSISAGLGKQRVSDPREKTRVPLCIEIRRDSLHSDSILSPELSPNCSSKHSNEKV